MQIIVIIVSLVLFSAIVGVLVKKFLVWDQMKSESIGSDDVLQRVSQARDVPDFFAKLGSRSRSKKIRLQLPDCLDLISNSLTAGLTLPQALMRNLEHFPPEAQREFARVIYDTRVGFSVADAFENFAGRLDLKDVKLIATASRIGVEHGGNIAESYRMLSALLRDNIAFEMELEAMTTEGRMQALVMSSLPFALIVILSFVNPDMMLPLLTTVAGWIVIGGLCLMLGTAYIWIRKIVSIEV